jgi:hypothetical protein
LLPRRLHDATIILIIFLAKNRHFYLPSLRKELE